MAEGRNQAREQSDLGTISQAVSQSCLTSEPLPARTFGILSILKAERASPAAQLVKNPPVPQESRVQSLGWEDPLEKEKASRSSTLAWRLPRTMCSLWDRKEPDRTERLSLSQG